MLNLDKQEMMQINSRESIELTDLAMLRTPSVIDTLKNDFVLLDPTAGHHGKLKRKRSCIA